MKLNEVEKRTFVMLLIASVFNGFVMGTFNIQDVLAKKALAALDWQVTILVMLWPLSNLFSIWWGRALDKSKGLAKFFLLTGFVGRLCLVFMLWVHNYYQYLLIMIVLFSFNALISPAQNIIYRNNLSKKNRGNLFGYSASIVTLIAVSFSFVSGKLLDYREDWFRYILLFAGVAGFISSMLMAAIKVKKKNFSSQKTPLKEFFLLPIIRTKEILKKDKSFAIFQRNFFIYGIGFMLMLPAIPKYLVDYLDMDYSQMFLAKGVISQLGILLLAPLAGKIHDNKNPSFFTFIVFFMLGLYPLIMFISTGFVGQSLANYFVYFAYLVFGIAMSGIVISWNISSIFFAKEEDVSMYQSVHVTLTGLRAIVVPFFGYLLIKFVNIHIVFVISVFMFWTASVLSYRHYLRMCEKEFTYRTKFVKVLNYFRKVFPFG